MEQVYQSREGVLVQAYKWPSNMTLERRSRLAFPSYIRTLIDRGDLFYTTLPMPVPPHKIGFTIRSGIMLVTGGPDDWIVVFRSGLTVVLSDAEFSSLFTPKNEQTECPPSPSTIPPTTQKCS